MSKMCVCVCARDCVYNRGISGRCRERAQCRGHSSSTALSSEALLTFLGKECQP